MQFSHVIRNRRPKFGIQISSFFSQFRFSIALIHPSRLAPLLALHLAHVCCRFPGSPTAATLWTSIRFSFHFCFLCAGSLRPASQLDSTISGSSLPSGSPVQVIKTSLGQTSSAKTSQRTMPNVLTYSTHLVGFLKYLKIHWALHICDGKDQLSFQENTLARSLPDFLFNQHSLFQNMDLAKERAEHRNSCH